MPDTELSGRELNRAIAEALGWTEIESAPSGWYDYGKAPDGTWAVVKSYSTDPAAALRLLEAVSKRVPLREIRLRLNWEENIYCIIEPDSLGDNLYSGRAPKEDWTLAIARACLTAILSGGG